MTEWIKWILALVLIWVVGGIVLHLLAGLVHIAITLAVIALFCYIVYAVARSVSRQKI